MVEITFEKIGAEKTVRNLIAIHLGTIADIDAGKKFTKEGKNVTSAIRARCMREVEQCHSVLHALNHMSAGNIQKCANLLREIQEYIPGVN